MPSLKKQDRFAVIRIFHRVSQGCALLSREQNPVNVFHQHSHLESIQLESN